MKLNSLLGILENEKPLDNIVLDGGYCSIFRNIGCIGDSLSSGEIEFFTGTTRHCYDRMEYSWGQHIAREAGVNVYNFSRGGMTAQEYMTTFGSSIDAFNPEKKCEAYIIALGVNDLAGLGLDVGHVNDTFDTHFSYYYQKIIEKYKEISPDAFFFLVNIPDHDYKDKRTNISIAKSRDLLYDFANYFSNTYVIDLFKYGPKYDEEFQSKFFLSSHMNPAGYKLTAKMIESYIDYIVRSDFEKFSKVGMINLDEKTRIV